jgi:type IV pilus assembly protein PilB
MYSNEDFLLELLRESGMVTEQDLEHVHKTKKPQETIIEGLIKSGVVSEEDVARTMAVNSGMEFVDLTGYVPAADLKLAVPEEAARRYRVVPLGFEHGRMQLAISDPNNFETLDALPHVLNAEVDFVCATPENIRTLLSAIYGNAGDMAETIVKGVEGGGGAEEAPIIRLVTNSLMEAFKARASDIHIEPMEKDLRMRYRPHQDHDGHHEH